MGIRTLGPGGEGGIYLLTLQDGTQVQAHGSDLDAHYPEWRSLLRGEPMTETGRQVHEETTAAIPTQQALAPAAVEDAASEMAVGKGLGPLPPLPGVGIDLMTLGKLLAGSGYFEDAKRISQAVVKVLAGQELDIGPIRAMTDIYVIEGKIGLGYALIASMIKRSGRYDYRIRKHDDKECSIEFFQARSGGEPESLGISTFTLEDAERAGLPKRGPSWKIYPRNMLFARALSNGARWYCPDVFGGAVYTPEELGEQVITAKDTAKEPAAV